MKHQQGYIALLSALVISALLLAITLSLGLSGFFVRLNVLDAESKERSVALAEACVSAAMLESVSGMYSANETVAVGQDTCKIVLSQKDYPVPGQATIKTQASFNKVPNAEDLMKEIKTLSEQWNQGKLTFEEQNTIKDKLRYAQSRSNWIASKEHKQHLQKEIEGLWQKMLQTI